MNCSPSWKPIFAAWASAVKPPKRYTPSEWAEEHFLLPAKGNAEPGKFRFARTPYLRGIVDAFVEPGVEDVVFIKPTRVGGTTAGQIVLGYWIDNDPGHCLTVMPSESAAEEEIKDRVRPLLESPSLKQHVSPDPHKNTLSRIELDTMDIYTGWAGSPQSLGSRTCKYVRFDEVDKYPPFAGREADPISLGKERTGTYGHRKRHYITSTPTTREGAIQKAWDGCGDKRTFLVPCPHCGTYQRLVWPQVKWPKLAITDKVKLADEVETSRLAWYECSNPDCKGRIEESHKPRMLERGVWVSEGQTVDNAGTVHGDRPASKRVGFHLSSIYSPWRKFWEMAAEFIRADGDIAAAMNFRNSRLAEPFETLIAKTESSKIREKSVGPAKVVPSWARLLIATADTQQDHFYYVVRAWGYEYRSQLVDYGICSTFEELKAYTIDASYKTEAGVTVHPQLLLIDSGGGRNADTGVTRTNEVYQFALSDPMRIKPVKGSSGRLQFPVDKSLQKAHGVVLWNVDTEQCKDHLSRLIHDGDSTKWLAHAEANDAYCTQMASEHKVVNPQTKKQEWKPKTSGAQNHFWDCETYQCAAAWDCRAGAPEPAEVPKPPTAQQSDRIAPSDFMNSGRKRW